MALDAPPPRPQAAETTDLYLSLDAFIAKVHERNERIRFQQLEWDISQDAVANAQAIFEPQFVASYLHDYSHIPKTVEDYSSLGFLDSESSTYTKRNNEYTSAVEGLLPTGAQVRLGYTLKQLRSSLLDAASTDAQYQTFIGGSLVQPLLKNAGSDATRANIRVAEADAAMAFQGYRRELLQVVSEAASAYWDLCLAQEKVGVRAESVRIAEAILEDNQERVRTGKMSATEVIEAEAGLFLRKSLEAAARQELMAAANAVKTLFSMPAMEMDGTVVATDRLALREIEADFLSAYEESRRTRPEYLSVLRIKSNGKAFAWPMPKISAGPSSISRPAMGSTVWTTTARPGPGAWPKTTITRVTPWAWNSGFRSWGDGRRKARWRPPNAAKSRPCWSSRRRKRPWPTRRTPRFATCAAPSIRPENTRMWCA